MHIIKTLEIFVKNALTVNGYSLTKKLNNGYTKSKNTAYLYTFHNFADSSSAGSSRSHAFCESEWCIFFKARLHCFICPRSRRLTGSQGWIRRAETYEISGKQIQRGTLCFVFLSKMNSIHLQSRKTESQIIAPENWSLLQIWSRYHQEERVRLRVVKLIHFSFRNEQKLIFNQALPFRIFFLYKL